MTLGMPSPAEERWLALAARYPAFRSTVAGLPAAGGWRTSRRLSRLGFFVLGVVAAFQAQGLVALLWVRIAGRQGGQLLSLMLGVLTLGVAELLIHRRRLFRFGLEEGLWLAGLVGINTCFMPSLVARHLALAIALPAALLLIAGLRLLNPLAISIGALLSSMPVSTIFGPLWHRGGAELASLWCLGIALLALTFGNRQLDRPSHDRMLDQLVIVMPLAGFAWSLIAAPAPITLRNLSGPWFPQLLPAVVPIVSATACFIMGIWRRTHAPLLSMLACKLCLLIALREVTGLPWRWLLIVWGTLALLSGLALDRWLRQPRWGITTAEPDTTPYLGS